MGLSCAREESSVEVEEGIREAKSVKEFMSNNKNNKKVIEDYKQSIQPSIDTMNEAVSQGECAGKKIKIGQIAEKELVSLHMKNLMSKFDFLPNNLLSCKSDDIFGSDAGQDFLDNHVRIGKCVVEIFRNRQKCDCKFCSTKPKSKEACKGHVPYPVKINKDEHSKFSEPVPLGCEMKETDCPSMIETKRKGRFFAQLNRLNKSTVLGYLTCVVCGKIRAFYGSRRQGPKTYEDWLKNVCGPAYEHQCGEPIFPENDVNHVELPCKEWIDERCRVEMRHNLFCSTPIESQACKHLLYCHRPC